MSFVLISPLPIQLETNSLGKTASGRWPTHWVPASHAETWRKLLVQSWLSEPSGKWVAKQVGGSSLLNISLHLYNSDIQINYYSFYIYICILLSVLIYSFFTFSAFYSWLLDLTMSHETICRIILSRPFIVIDKYVLDRLLLCCGHVAFPPGTRSFSLCHFDT